MGRPTFAFRLHQFYSRGETVWATPESVEDRFATVHEQRLMPGDRTKVLLPLAFCRACGQEYYVGNQFLWAKMAAFAGVALLSIRPTISIIRWRTAVRANPAFQPQADEIMTTRRFMHGEAMLFTFIPIFAALMARYG